MSKTAIKEENPLINIMVNVLLPTVVLTKLSKEDGAFYHLGPKWAMIVALALPLFYGIWHWLKHRKLNIFSTVGMGAILLTGLITIYLWSNDAAKTHVAWIFGIKEAIQPLILGSLFLFTHRSSNPLFRTFIYNDAIFDVKKIEASVAKNNLITQYNGMIWKCTLYFFCSFCLSAILNLFMAHYFLADLAPNIPNWKEQYNEIIGSITIWGFAAIGVPMTLVTLYIFFSMIKGLEKLTGLEKENILLLR